MEGQNKICIFRNEKLTRTGFLASLITDSLGFTTEKLHKEISACHRYSMLTLPLSKIRRVSTRNLNFQIFVKQIVSLQEISFFV